MDLTKPLLLQTIPDQMQKLEPDQPDILLRVDANIFITVPSALVERIRRKQKCD